MSNQGQTLDLTNVISVSVLPTPAQLGSPVINSLAIFTKDSPIGWAVGQVYGVYNSLSGVAADWGINSNAYAIAAAVLSQTPNPIGANGYIVIVPRLTTPTLETTRAAILRTMNLVYYYGVLIDEEMGSAGAEFVALCSYVQSVKKLFAYCSSSIADLEVGSMLDAVRTASEFRCRMFYYGNAILNGAGAQQTQIFAGAYLGRGLCVDFSGVGTAITMHGKQLVGVTSDQTIDQTALGKAQAAGIDVYVSVAGIPMVFCSNKNVWFDEVYNEDWLAQALQVSGFNYLIPAQFKIPQTEEGMGGLKDAYRNTCEQAKTAGVCAPGSWTSAVPAGLPQALFKDNIEKVGYFVYSIPISKQSTSDRAARKAPLVQIAMKLAGAIHSSNVLVLVNE